MAHYDLYSSLGLDKSSSSESLAAELDRRLGEGTHTNPGGEEELKVARAILGDEQKRSMYNSRLDDPQAQEITISSLRDLAQMNFSGATPAGPSAPAGSGAAAASGEMPAAGSGAMPAAGSGAMPAAGAAAGATVGAGAYGAAQSGGYQQAQPSGPYGAAQGQPSGAYGAPQSGPYGAPQGQAAQPGQAQMYAQQFGGAVKQMTWSERISRATGGVVLFSTLFLLLATFLRMFKTNADGDVLEVKAFTVDGEFKDASALPVVELVSEKPAIMIGLPLVLVLLVAIGAGVLLLLNKLPRIGGFLVVAAALGLALMRIPLGWAKATYDSSLLSEVSSAYDIGYRFDLGAGYTMTTVALVFLWIAVALVLGTAVKDEISAWKGQQR